MLVVIRLTVPAGSDRTTSSAGISLGCQAFLYAFKNKLLEYAAARSGFLKSNYGCPPGFLRRLRKASRKIDPRLTPPTARIGLSPDVIATYAKRSAGGLAGSMSFTVLAEQGTMPDFQQRFIIDIAE